MPNSDFNKAFEPAEDSPAGRHMPLRPLFILAFVVGGVLPALLYIATNPVDYRETTRSELIISWPYFVYHISWIVAALFAFMVFSKRSKRSIVNFTNDPLNVLYSWTLLVFLLTLVGYAFYFFLCRDIIFSGGGNDFNVEKKTLDLTGTGYPIILIHLHLAFTVLAAYLLVFRRIEGRGHRLVLVSCVFVMFVLDLTRAIGVGERLALIECVLPFPLFYLARKSLFVQTMWIAVSLAGLFVFFVVSESTRSWLILQDSDTSGDVWTFGLNRLLAYYTSSINNSSVAHIYNFSQETSGYYLFRGFFNTPILGRILDMNSILGDNKSDSWFYIIESIPELNPEFNLFSSPGFSYLDFGYFGIFVGVLWGSICGIVVRAAERGNAFATFLFPVMIISALELSRTLYFSLERNIPTYAILLIIATFAVRRSAPPELQPEQRQL